MFLELFYNLLRIGGRAAVIVPNGVLFGSSNVHKQARKMILEKCQLEAVISLPSGVFQPYAGVSTAVLVFVKGGKTENVWFYEILKDGYSMDQKRNFIDGKGDIPDLLEKHKKHEKSDQSFSINYEEIIKNDYSLSISRYKELKFEKVVKIEPKLLIKKLLDLEKEIEKALIQLRESI